MIKKDPLSICIRFPNKRLAKQIQKMASESKRTRTGMIEVLLTEAVAARNDKAKP